MQNDMVCLHVIIHMVPFTMFHHSLSSPSVCIVAFTTLHVGSTVEITCRKELENNRKYVGIDIKSLEFREKLSRNGSQDPAGAKMHPRMPKKQKV